uniref:Uncharacterized protein n=1 Tax=Anguilla anguilla TaxID=7936 RepID=A0A0E9SGZ3_ANGAN
MNNHIWMLLIWLFEIWRFGIPKPMQLVSCSSVVIWMELLVLNTVTAMVTCSNVL